jgi:glucosyl-dolichyl phosphate glucuronosyltransferase
MIDNSSHKSALTVAICTHNRSRQLARLVGSLKSDLFRLGVHLLVIDSASGPSCATAIDELVQQEPWLRLIRLERSGVSHARNAALDATDTPWLAFVDDDEMPAPGWLDAVELLTGRLPADCAACGGNVFPAWPGSAPDIGVRWRNYLSIIEQSGEFDQTAMPRFGIGHSLLRVPAIREVGGFSRDLGRVGSSLLSGEESLLVLALANIGWKIWHSDRISVAHDIAIERLDRTWALTRAYWEGVSTARSLYLAEDAMLGDLRRWIRTKRRALKSMTKLVGSFQEMDLRLEFVRGVEFELAVQAKSSVAMAAPGRGNATIAAIQEAIQPVAKNDVAPLRIHEEVA